MSDIVPVTELPTLPRRPADGHKGTFGTVLVVAGSRGMSGAAVLCGTAALRAGAGLVQVACPDDVLPMVAAGFPCYTTVPFGPAHDDLVDRGRKATALAVGPGLGQAADTAKLVRDLLNGLPDKSVVVDADGLNVLSPFADEFRGRSAPLVLTPHPGEFARLTGGGVPRTQPDREREAAAFAGRFGVVVLLKGSNTVVTDGRRLYRNATGNPGMATGGVGDVLTGVIAALIGQGMTAFDAAALGAWVHGRAGDHAAAALGQTSTTSADVLAHLPVAFRELEAGW